MNLPLTDSGSHAVKYELAVEVLGRSGKLRLQLTGWSMLPTIFPGDTVIIERADCTGVSEGEIVLCARAGRFVIHRVTRKSADDATILTRGDAMAQPDPPVANRDLLGKVSYILRAGKQIVPARALRIPERAAATLIRRSHFAARVLMKVHQLQQRSRNSNSHDQVVPCQS